MEDDTFEDDFKTIITETDKLYKQMKNQIEALINQVIGYNRAYEREDYRQEAWPAIRDAMLRYSRFHMPTTRESYKQKEEFREQCSVMKPDVFAGWFLRKALYKMANVQEVEFDIYDAHGDFVETLSNTEYRKKRQVLQRGGFIAKASKNTYSFSELKSQQNDREKEYEPVDGKSWERMAG